VQSATITTKVVSSNPVHGEVYSIQHYVLQFISDFQHVWFSPGTPFSSTNKTARHDIAEILLKVALKAINPQYPCSLCLSTFISTYIVSFQLQAKSYPRSLLQKILFDIVGYVDDGWKGLRKLDQKCNNMYEYVTRAFEKLKLPTDKVTSFLFSFITMMIIHSCANSVRELLSYSVTCYSFSICNE
jgi:hypothetical protein